jgi:hypothetical protein
MWRLKFGSLGLIETVISSSCMSLKLQDWSINVGRVLLLDSVLKQVKGQFSFEEPKIDN